MRLILCERKHLNIGFLPYPKLYAGILFHDFRRNMTRTHGTFPVQKKAKSGNQLLERNLNQESCNEQTTTSLGNKIDGKETDQQLHSKEEGKDEVSSKDEVSIIGAKKEEETIFYANCRGS